MAEATFGPRCPNHGVPLTDCKGGQGICPISGAIFGYEADEQKRTKKLKLNALGQAEEVEDFYVKHLAGKDK